MQLVRVSTSVLLLLFLTPACPLQAQTMSQKGRDPQQIWFALEKQLKLSSSYAAEIEMQVMGMNMPGKIFRDHDQSRSEMNMPMINMPMVILQRMEQGKPVSYTLFPDKKRYCLNPADKQPLSADDLAYTLTEAGYENYLNERCTKRHLTVKLADGATHNMEILFSPKQKQMPVKITTHAKIQAEPGAAPTTITSVVLFKNYRFGKQPAVLFAIPAGYTQARDMQEVMMGALFGSAGVTPDSASQASTNSTVTLPAAALQALSQTDNDADAAPAASQQQETDTQAEALRKNLQSLRNLLGK